MWRSIQLLGAKALSHLVTADRLCSLSKVVFLRELLRELQIEVVIDVGANAGQFAMTMRYMGFCGSLVSFEPIPEVFAMLEKRMGRDRNWSGHNLAIGDVECTREFNVMESTLYSSFNVPADDADGSNRVTRTCHVEVRRLDRLVGTRDLGRTLLKVDTQGYEMQVFRGLGERLRSVRAIMCEVSVNALYERTPRLNEIVTFLDENGFKAAFFSPIGRAGNFSAREFDYICVRP